MKDSSVVICGNEKKWLGRFAEALRTQAPFPVKVREASDPDALRRAISEQAPDLVILPEEAAEAFMPFCEVMYFTEEERPEDERAIYRYRPVSRSIRQIAERMTDRGERSLRQAVSRIEPALVIVGCLLVGLILLCVMLPLMNIMSAIG